MSKRSVHPERFRTIEYLPEEIASIIEDGDHKVSNYQKVITLCRKKLHELRIEVHTHGFKEESEEVLFFRHVKPIPLSNLLYYQELLHLELRVQFGLHRKHEFPKMMDIIACFFDIHASFIEYIMMDLSHRDQYYFTRNNSEFEMGSMNINTMTDPAFNTLYDPIMARFLAYRRLMKELNPENTGDTVPNLKWKSSKTALVELIYGLYYSKVFGSGKPDIQTLAKVLERTFDIELDNLYRTFHEIKRRKSNRPDFLYEMAYRVEQQITEEHF